MAEPQISLSWPLYYDNMKSGFSYSQQNGDFVDLTLAADGHLVKVHQLVLGIASPYIKSLIKSAPSQHPIIFLNNVSYPTLCNLLEYVYTGEVAIPEDNLEMFLNLAKSLQIQGLDDMVATNEIIDNSMEIKSSDDVIKLKPNLKKINIIQDTTIKIGSVESASTDCLEENVSNIEKKIALKNKPSSSYTVKNENLPETSKNSQDNSIDSLDETMIHNDTLKESVIIGSAENKFELAPVSDMSTDLYNYANSQVQYTVSSRGSLQLILNRYMYNLFSRSNKGQIRRWRCVDYRDRKCPACCITNGNDVVRRTNMHIHSFHDKKILAKIQKKAIYSAIKAVNSTEECEM